MENFLRNILTTVAQFLIVDIRKEILNTFHAECEEMSMFSHEIEQCNVVNDWFYKNVDAPVPTKHPANHRSWSNSFLMYYS